MILGWHCSSRSIHIHSGNINIHLPTRSSNVMGWQVSSSQLTWAMSNHFSFHHVSMIFDRLSILFVLFCIVLFYMFSIILYVGLLFFFMMIWLKSTNGRHHVVAARHVKCRWPPVTGWHWADMGRRTGIMSGLMFLSGHMFFFPPSKLITHLI
jgi:hypothetical protein